MINMQAMSTHTLATALALAVAATLAGQVRAGSELVTFPKATPRACAMRLWIEATSRRRFSRAANRSHAVKNGQPIPSGTVITLVDERDGELFRYVAMEKRTDWGAEYPPEKRNGEWEYQAFKADKSVNDQEDLNRGFACYKTKAQQDFVFTFDQMKSVKWVGCV